MVCAAIEEISHASRSVFTNLRGVKMPLGRITETTMCARSKSGWLTRVCNKLACVKDE